MALAACDPADPADAAPSAAAGCVDGGLFRAALYGDLQGALAWHGAGLACTGMRRPHGAGARLRFAGQQGDDALAFIIALPALAPAATGQEFSATVTLMQEDAGRFYSNGEAETCWADVSRHEPLDDGQRYDVGGIVYCVAPLPALSGGGSVSVRDLEFRGVLDWKDPD